MTAQNPSTLNAFTQSLPEIQSMGIMLFDPVWGERLHDAAHCELIYVIKGEVELETTDSSHRAGPGEFLLIPPRTPHRDCFDPEAGLEVFWTSFDWEPMRLYHQHVSNESLSALPPYRRAEIATLFDQIRANLSHADEVDQLVARARLQTILLILLQDAKRQKDCDSNESGESYGKARRVELMREAKAYLESHYAECIALDEIAAALNVSGYYLSHVFSEESDVSLFTYLTTLRMEKAKVLLAEGKHNVSEVARSVGYESANYFSKVFRKNCGLSPRDYTTQTKKS
ncbi:MAG: AraC family transcriptional regulator [Planctomycetota bacterium]|jgi:AraC-like DNA-binding protein